MFKKLQQRWKVSPIRLLLILIAFATGGILTGYAGKKLMNFTGIDNPVFYIPVYIIVITLIWPLMVLLISIPLGQYRFFMAYLNKLYNRITGNHSRIKNTGPDMGEPIAPEGNTSLEKFNALKASKTQIKKIAIFASGAGSNAQKIIDHFRHSANIQVAIIATNKPTAGVTEIAGKENIPTLIIEKETFFRGDAYVPHLKHAGINLIVLAGFLWKIPTPLINAFPRSIINIHPALLPDFGGKGMYGDNVHQAVLQAGKKESGITIHYVDEHYDNGDIIFQAKCAILENDTPGQLAQRIHVLEHANYPLIIEQLLQ